MALPERSSKLDPFAGRLPAWLKMEFKKGRRQKRTMQQLHADLMGLGYRQKSCVPTKMRVLTHRRIIDRTAGEADAVEVTIPASCSFGMPMVVRP